MSESPEKPVDSVDLTPTVEATDVNPPNPAPPVDAGASHGPPTVDSVKGRETAIEKQPEVPPDEAGTVEFHSTELPASPSTEVAPRPTGADSPTQIAGYEVLGVLGRGAMGVVYKARQPGLKRIVALKMIRSGDLADQRDLLRFRAEAEAAARLTHPNIVQIYEVGEHEGRPFFSLEYVAGGSLQQRLTAGPAPVRPAAELIATLARAVQYAHSRGVVHRDLKPANVLIADCGLRIADSNASETSTAPEKSDLQSAIRNPQSAIKLTDFGLAKLLDEDASSTQSGTILGSPSYMAREQAEGKGKEVGPLADVYALGAILYEMLTGRPPFRGATLLETLDQVRTLEPAAPTQLQPSVPRDLETICLKCLQKEARRRYAGAAELADDLERFLRGEPILARPLSAPARFGRWCRRNPRLAAVYTLAVALLLGWAGTSSWLAWALAREKAAADAARADAVQNAELAKVNEHKAVEQARVAQENARKVTIARDNALGRHDQTIRAMIDLGSTLHRRFQVQAVADKLGPEAKAVRDDIVRTVVDAMLRLSRQMQKDALTSFGLARSHQMMGDLLKELGQGEDALKQYQKGLELVQQVVDSEPDNDLARGNQALMLSLVGGKTLELNGDARAAQKTYQRSYEIQKEIADHPRSGFYRDRPPDNERLLSNYRLQLGRAALLRTNLREARRCFEEAVALRKQVVAAVTVPAKEVEAVSYLSEAYYWLGQACAMEGDDKAAQAAFTEAAAICEGLSKRFPQSHDFRNDLADVYGAWGDAHLRAGRSDEARRLYEKALPLVQAAFDRQPDHLAYRALLARTYHRLGVVASKKEEKDAALQKALPLREQLTKLDPHNVFAAADLAATQAHSGKVADAVRTADALTRQISHNPALALRLAGSYARCAALATEAEKASCKEKTTAALRAVVADGSLNLRVFKGDPDLEELREQAKELASGGR
jgi:serine/threonine-protein kinase